MVDCILLVVMESYLTDFVVTSKVRLQEDVLREGNMLLNGCGYVMEFEASL